MSNLSSSTNTDNKRTIKSKESKDNHTHDDRIRQPETLGCAWDDDDFDDTFGNVGQNDEGMIGSFGEDKSDNQATEKKEEDPAVSQRLEEEKDGNAVVVVDDWLKPALSRGGTVVERGTTRGNNELFLTKQFKSLSTPVSKKKPRCMNCTRPLMNQNDLDTRLCGRCRKSKVN